MHDSASVEISQPASIVFVAITTSAGAEIWHDALVSMKYHSGPLSGIGKTHVELTDLGFAIVEIVGVVIEENRPYRSVTAIRYIRFLPLPLERLTPGDSTKTEAELGRQFRLSFGKTPPEGIVIVDVNSVTETSCTLRFTVDIKMRGLLGLASRAEKLIRLTPTLELLTSFKSWIENQP